MILTPFFDPIYNRINIGDISAIGKDIIPRLFILCLHDYSAALFLVRCAFMWMAGVKAGMCGVKIAATT